MSALAPAERETIETLARSARAHGLSARLDHDARGWVVLVDVDGIGRVSVCDVGDLEQLLGDGDLLPLARSAGLRAVVA